MSCTPTYEYLAGLLSACQPPCLSLYQPTHRHHPDNQKDPILFRNLVRRLEDSLKREYAAREVRDFLEPLQSLAGDRDFWNHTLDGLAVFRAPSVTKIFQLQRSVPALAVVATSFHVKPLVRVFQSADRYQILSLTRSEIGLFEGNRYAVDEVDLADEVPRTRAEAVGEKRGKPHLTVASYGKGAEGAPVYHGHGSKKDGQEVETERFFRMVDKAILEHHSRSSRLPLMLAALPEHQSLFRRISANPFLLKRGIEGHPGSLSSEEMRERAWQAFEPHYKERLDGLLEEFAWAKSRRLTVVNRASVAKAAAAGNVATLLVEADRHLPGKLDPDTGAIAPADLEHPEIDDLLDDLAELVLKKGGQVMVLPVERMPTKTGVAAIRRF